MINIAKLRIEMNKIVKEISEVELECGKYSRQCPGCKWNRRIRKVLLRTLKTL